MNPESFTPELRRRAKNEYGVLVRIEVDGRDAVDVDLGKRHMVLTFVETGDMVRTKQLRNLMHAWFEEDRLLERR